MEGRLLCPNVECVSPDRNECYRCGWFEGRQESLKEVVEWVNENFADFMPKHNEVNKMGEHWQKWQDYLKRSGIGG